MKKLLVGTIFIDDSPPQQTWLDLQLRYLAATTQDYDHVAVVSEGLTNDVFEKRTKVLVPPDKEQKGSMAHHQSLNGLLDYFLQRQDQYENFLFIDGDAFPIRQNWLPALLSKMQPQDVFDSSGAAFPYQRGQDYEVAVILRSENLETRLHASVLFVRGPFLKNINFELGVAGKDLLCREELDIYLPTYQHERRHMAFPLIRTNQMNVHPVACGIYFDSFYHHCCGSGRPLQLRSKGFYFQKILPPMEDLTKFTTTIFNQPNEFVAKLAGWNPTKYATI
jgi:hypothetical protein